MHPVQAFCEWLAATALSTEIQSVGWIVPALQTIHILSIAIVMSAAAMVDLHVLGILSQSLPLAAVARRFLPWIWWTLIVLLLSGSALIIGEPGRSHVDSGRCAGPDAFLSARIAARRPILGEISRPPCRGPTARRGLVGSMGRNRLCWTMDCVR
jgi:hypothetical protein